MTKASDNVFPKLIGAEGAAPGTPAANTAIAYVKADGLWYSKDDAGVETLMSGGVASGIPATIVDAAGDIIVASAADTVARLAIGSTGHVLTVIAGTTAWAANPFAPWLVDIIPMISDPSSNTGPWSYNAFTPASDSGINYPFYGVGSVANSGAAQSLISNGVQNDEISWKVALSAGTWNASFHVRKANNTGIITLNLDAASQGTVDTYAAAVAYAKVQITGWTVATDGAHTIQVKMATKNASSSAYYGELFAISLRRTA